LRSILETKETNKMDQNQNDFDMESFKNTWANIFLNRTTVASLFGIFVGGAMGIQKGRDLALEYISKLPHKPQVSEVC
jgi:hypothetical protein